MARRKKKQRTRTIIAICLVLALAAGGSLYWKIRQDQARNAAATAPPAEQLEPSSEPEPEPELKPTAPTPPAEPALTPPPAAKPGDAASSDPATPLPNSTFAFIDRLSSASVAIDPAEFLTGEQAASAASARGDESPPPNDYYIVNDDHALKTYPVAADAKVILVSMADGTSDPNGYSVTVEQWVDLFARNDEGSFAIRGAGYWFALEDGVVTQVREQFTP